MGELHARGAADVTADTREIAGSGPTSVTSDITFVAPPFAPGTGTPEVGGPTSRAALFFPEPGEGQSWRRRVLLGAFR